MNETWKSIDGYENYEVSDLGNIRNCRSRLGFCSAHEVAQGKLKQTKGYTFRYLEEVA